ncbi:hypothetical protein KJ713_00315 [Patescibacteria group bacterium]|nr:hypothetical protein [Patescibacteria group bacterium]
MKKFVLKKEELLAIVLIIFAVASRLLPHPANFAPIAAVGIFSAFVFKNKLLRYGVPIIAMLLSDTIIGFYAPLVMLAVYLSFFIATLLGRYLKNHQNLSNGVGVSLLASLQFYLITNLAVFLFTPMYAKNLQGLINCYYLALPFFRNTILGDLVYTGAIFGLYFGLKYFLAYLQKSKLSIN